jgi:protein-disulfide isomerase
MKKAEEVEIIPSKKIIVGNANAPVTLVMFGDYESIPTAKANEVVKKILAAFPEDVKFNFRHFPLVQVHQKAHKAAEASLAAAQEGKFWEMHNELFANRHSLGTISLKGHARDVGVKSKKFLEELLSSHYGVHIQDDLKEGINRGITDIPVFFINDVRYKEEISFKAMSAHIEGLLKKEKSKSKRVKSVA